MKENPLLMQITDIRCPVYGVIFYTQTSDNTIYKHIWC